jgi:hypothetical protein
LLLSQLRFQALRHLQRIMAHRVDGQGSVER